MNHTFHQVVLKVNQIPSLFSSTGTANRYFSSFWQVGKWLIWVWFYLIKSRRPGTAWLAFGCFLTLLIGYACCVFTHRLALVTSIHQSNDKTDTAILCKRTTLPMLYVKNTSDTFLYIYFIFCLEMQYLCLQVGEILLFSVNVEGLLKMEQ